MKLHYIRARVKGICSRCQDGGCLEVSVHDDIAHRQCVYCRLQLPLTVTEAVEILKKGLETLATTPQATAAKLRRRLPGIK